MGEGVHLGSADILLGALKLQPDVRVLRTVFGEDTHLHTENALQAGLLFQNLVLCLSRHRKAVRGHGGIPPSRHVFFPEF
jgi:hypothetical protein